MFVSSVLFLVVVIIIIIIIITHCEFFPPALADGLSLELKGQKVSEGLLTIGHLMPNPIIIYSIYDL